MTAQQEIYATPDEIWEEVQPLYGGVNYRLPGNDILSRVLLVDRHDDHPLTPYVVKAPAPYNFGGGIEAPPELKVDMAEVIKREAGIVAALASASTPPPVEVPRLIGYNETLPCAVYSYVPGETLGMTYAQELFTPQEKQDVGRRVGQFVRWLNTIPALQPYEEADMIKRKQEGGLSFALSYALQAAGRFYDHPHLLPLALRVQADFVGQQTRGFGEVVLGHDDLRFGNLTFQYEKRQGWQLHGVIDFAFLNRIPLGRELRGILPLGRSVCHEALRAYYMSDDTPPDPRLDQAEDAARLWSMIEAVRVSLWRVYHRQELNSAALMLERLLQVEQ